jgi:F-box-like
MTFARPATHDQVPPELWQEIFRISILPRSSHKSDVELVFQPSEPKQWKTRRSLVLVCKRWRAMATKYLYQEVMFDRKGKLLLETLEQSAQNSAGYGICILPRYTNPPIRFLDVLRYCPLVETIIKPGPINFGQDLPDPNFWQDIFHVPHGKSATLLASLASLRHLKWFDSCHETNREDLMALAEIIVHAPNLQTLDISIKLHLVDDLFGQLTCRRIQPEINLLPSLGSFTFGGAAPDVSRLGLRPTDMPKLTCLKIFPCQRGRAPEFPAFLSLIGMRLHTVELKTCNGKSCRHNVWHIRRDCPNLRELSYDVHNTEIVPTEPPSHASLSCIRLRYDPDCWSQWPWIHDSEWAANVWAQFVVFANPAALPALKRVVLLGDWAKMMSDSGFLLLQQSGSVGELEEFLGKRSCRLEYPGDTVI